MILHQTDVIFQKVWLAPLRTAIKIHIKLVYHVSRSDASAKCQITASFSNKTILTIVSYVKCQKPSRKQSPKGIRREIRNCSRNFLLISIETSTTKFLEDDPPTRSRSFLTNVEKVPRNYIIFSYLKTYTVEIVRNIFL